MKEKARNWLLNEKNKENSQETENLAEFIGLIVEFFEYLQKESLKNHIKID